MSPWLFSENYMSHFSRIPWPKIVSRKYSNTHAKTIPGLALEQRVLVAHVNKFLITESSLVRHTRQVWVSLLAVLANDETIVELVLTEEPLSVVAAVDVDLSEGIVSRRFIDAFMHSGFQPRQKQLQSKQITDQLLLRVSIENSK